MLPGGTAYQTDVGMCGAVNAVIGMDTARAEVWMRQQLGEDVTKPPWTEPGPPYAADAVLIDVAAAKKSRSITRLSTRQ